MPDGSNRKHMSSCGSNAYQLVNNQWLDMDSDEYDEYMAGRDVEHKRLARAGREQQQFYAGRVDIVRDMVEVVYASARNPISFSVRAQGNRVVCVGVGKA